MKGKKRKEQMKKNDIVMAMFWILLGLTISIWSSTFPFGGLAHPGPAYFPVGLGLVIIVFGVIVFFQVWKARKEGEGKPSPSPSSKEAATRRVVFCLTGMVVSAVLFERLGFVLTMFFMVLFMMRTIAPQKWKTALFYSIVSASGSLFVFKVLLKTQLPSGFLGF
jgi:putative tricarboxylic transport membrane protein